MWCMAVLYFKVLQTILIALPPGSFGIYQQRALEGDCASSSCMPSTWAVIVYFRKYS